MQGYLATCETADRLISDAGLDWRTERQARFARGTCSMRWRRRTSRGRTPRLKESIDAGGANLVRGTRRFVRDMTLPSHLPASVDVTKFEVGGNLAVTPGSVVLRTDVFELIQYRPANKQVHEVPLLFVPPTINKYCILDISPGRSMVEWLLAQQQQVWQCESTESVSGGTGNEATGTASSVSGGADNTAGDPFSAIGGVR
jgi:polyhydroxyalkanoate synthase